MGHLFNRIRDLGVPAIVVMDKMDVTQLNRLATANLRFYDQPLPIAQVARECDFAILNATHGATCAFLQAGRPLVQLPQNYEQSITALRTFQLGAGIVANPNSGEQVDQAFLTMLSDHNKFSGAAKFAEKYGDRDSGATATRIAQRIDQLLAQSSSRRLKK
ncbi:MAG: hypothetical protein KDB00_28795 [Planctomycetales bacterium]|nr:hypothetical protein [Planctomycetales bacterium]